MDVHSRLELLNTDSWFADLPYELKQELAVLKTRRFRCGELIHAKGEPPQGLFALLEGSARVCTVAPNGKELLLTVLEAGHWFGITSAIDGLAHTHDVIASEEALLLCMQTSEFFVLLDRHPEYAIDFARWAALQLRRVFQGVEDTSLLGMEALLAKRIMNLVAIDGPSKSSSNEEIQVQLSQTDLANLLGTTRQSINKQLKNWEAAGYIKIRYGQIVVIQADALKQLFEP